FGYSEAAARALTVVRDADYDFHEGPTIIRSIAPSIGERGIDQLYASGVTCPGEFLYAKLESALAMIRPRFLEHPSLEFSGPSQGDRFAVSPGLISVIGVLLPVAPWGRSSL